MGLTSDCETCLSFLGARGVNVKVAGVTAFVPVADAFDENLAGVLQVCAQLHMVLPAHTVRLARHIRDERLVLHVQPANLLHLVSIALD